MRPWHSAFRLCLRGWDALVAAGLLLIGCALPESPESQSQSGELSTDREPAMTCDGVSNLLFFVVIPLVSLYLCVERFREAQEKKPWTGR